jgi:hypothetical protein
MDDTIIRTVYDPREKARRQQQVLARINALVDELCAQVDQSNREADALLLRLKEMGDA